MLFFYRKWSCPEVLRFEHIENPEEHPTPGVDHKPLCEKLEHYNGGLTTQMSHHS